jgi:hypothetical protein
MVVSRCAIHEVDELVTDEGRVCFECKHSYVNDEAVVQMAIEQWSLSRDYSADMIFCCPLCLHDW